MTNIERKDLPITEPSSRFLKSQEEVSRLWGFLISMAFTSDRSFLIMKKALFEIADEEEKQSLKKDIEEGGGKLKTLQSHQQLLLQMIHCRLVDNYLTYISDLMALVFRTRPETLKSGESIKLDEVLQHSNMDSLIDHIAEKWVNQLSYQGMKSLSNYFSERLGFNLFESEDDLQRAICLIEIRNIITHNRAIINRIFLSRVPNYPGQIDQQIEMSPDEVLDNMKFLMGLVAYADSRISKKFNLPRPIMLSEILKCGTNQCYECPQKLLNLMKSCEFACINL